MNAEQLTLLIDELKKHIVSLLHNTDHSKDSDVQKTLLTINKIFDELGLTVQEVLPVELAKSYFIAIDEATEDLQEQGIQLNGRAIVDGVVQTEFKTQANVEALSNIVTDTMLDMQAAIRTAKENFNDTYLQTLEAVRSDISKGMLDGNNREAIIKRVSDTFLQDGFTSFKTVDGKQLPLDFYSRTVVRTKMRTATSHGHLTRYEEAGVNLVTITGREPTCGICARYRNHVFSIDGEDKRFPHINVYELFPLHPNCECRIRPFVIEYKSQSEINKAVVKAKSFNPDIDPRAQKQKDAYKQDQDKKRIARQEDKHYIKMKAILGDKAPKNIGAYRNIKRNNPSKFEVLRQQMKGVVKDENSKTG